MSAKRLKAQPSSALLSAPRPFSVLLSPPQPFSALPSPPQPSSALLSPSLSVTVQQLCCLLGPIVIGSINGANESHFRTCPESSSITKTGYMLLPKRDRPGKMALDHAIQPIISLLFLIRCKLSVSKYLQVEEMSFLLRKTRIDIGYLAF